MPTRPRHVTFAALEPRRLAAAGAPTQGEQYLLELINRGRADPTAEAARFNVGLNEGLAAGTITSSAKQPLAMNGLLVTAMRDQMNWLRTNGKFQHEGPGGNSPTTRMTNAGFSLTGSWGTGENIGVTMSTAAQNVTAEIEANYKNLFVDANYEGRGHRLNLLNGSFETVGTGISTGSYNYGGRTWTSAVLVGQDFAYTSAGPALTGVAYDDALVRKDDFYTPGEALAGIAIKAVGSPGTFNTTTDAAGGYALSLPAGTYSVTATNSAGKTVTLANVTIGSQNVKRDFTAAQFTTATTTPTAIGDGVTLENGLLTIVGTSGNDAIALATQNDGSIRVTRNGVSVTATGATKVRIDGGDGDDTIETPDLAFGATLVGGAGRDSILGGLGADSIDGGDGDDYLRGNSGDDTIRGGLGADYVNGNGGRNYLYGDDGDDRLAGGGGRDFLYGGQGDDRLYGNAGNDRLDGGANVDRLYGGDGDDELVGGGSNDRLYGDAGNDTLAGNSGTDSFNGGDGTDVARDRTSIESVLGIESFV